MNKTEARLANAEKAIDALLEHMVSGNVDESFAAEYLAANNSINPEAYPYLVDKKNITDASPQSMPIKLMPCPGNESSTSSFMPTRNHESAAYDVRANIANDIIIRPADRAAIPLGFSMSLEVGTFAQLSMRSGLARKRLLIMPNAPGVIDEDFTGEWELTVYNLSPHPITISPLMRVAQFIIQEYKTYDFKVVDDLAETERGDRGHGSSGEY